MDNHHDPMLCKHETSGNMFHHNCRLRLSAKQGRTMRVPRWVKVKCFSAKDDGFVEVSHPSKLKVPLASEEKNCKGV